jgi:single-strand DNA-binding protein
MGSVNHVALLGRLGDDPDQKFTQAGMAITKIRIATESTRKDKEGNRQTRTHWHRVTLFGRLAEVAGEYLRRGSECYVEGEVCYSESEHDGTKRYYTDIEANKLVLIGGRQQERSEPRERPRRELPAEVAKAAEEFEPDDIPW